MKKSIFQKIISCLLILLWVYAAVNKLTGYEQFGIQLAGSPYIANYAGLLTWMVPTVELMAALLLLFSKTQRVGLLLSIFLLSAFTAYLVIILQLSYYVPCSCGGIISGLSWQGHIVLNLSFLVAASIAVLTHDKTSFLLLSKADNILLQR